MCLRKTGNPIRIDRGSTMCVTKQADLPHQNRYISINERPGVRRFPCLWNGESRSYSYRQYWFIPTTHNRISRKCRTLHVMNCQEILARHKKPNAQIKIHLSFLFPIKVIYTRSELNGNFYSWEESSFLRGNKHFQLTCRKKNCILMKNEITNDISHRYEVAM